MKSNSCRGTGKDTNPDRDTEGGSRGGAGGTVIVREGGKGRERGEEGG